METVTNVSWAHEDAWHEKLGEKPQPGGLVQQAKTVVMVVASAPEQVAGHRLGDKRNRVANIF
jgi:hypothetical protein